MFPEFLLALELPACPVALRHQVAQPFPEHTPLRVVLQSRPFGLAPQRRPVQQVRRLRPRQVLRFHRLWSHLKCLWSDLLDAVCVRRALPRHLGRVVMDCYFLVTVCPAPNQNFQQPMLLGIWLTKMKTRWDRLCRTQETAKHEKMKGFLVIRRWKRRTGQAGVTEISGT